MDLWQSLPHSSCLSAVLLGVGISTFSYPPASNCPWVLPHLLVGLQATTSGSWGLASSLLLHLQIISPLPALLAQRCYCATSSKRCDLLGSSKVTLMVFKLMHF